MHTGRTDPVTGPDWMPITRKRGPYSVPIHNSGEAPRPNPQRPLALAAGTALRAPIGTRDPSGALVNATAVAIRRPMRPVWRIERDLHDPQTPKERGDHLCFVTMRG